MFKQAHLLSAVICTVFFMFMAPLLSQANEIKNPGVELRQLEEVTPTLYRAPKPIEFTVPEAEPMKAVSDAKLTITDFTLSGNTAFSDDELLVLLENYKGTITFQNLFVAVNKVTVFYRDQGFMVARAYVPEQEVSDGSVEITILEGVLGDVQVSGDSPIKSSRLVKYFERQVQSASINAADMEYGALLLNDLPGTSANINLSPGSQTGLTNIGLQMEDEGRYDFALDYNNFGATVTGEHRFGVQIGINNLFKSGDRFSFRPIVSDTGDTLYGALDFTMPIITPATKIGLHAARLESELGEDFEFLEIENTANILSLSATHAFIRSRNKNLIASFEYTVQQFDRFCGFCQGSFVPGVDDADYDLDFIQLGVSGDLRDERWGGGGTTWYAAYRRGLTDIDKNNSGIIVNGGDRTEGKFNSLRLGAHRVQRLRDKLSLSLKLDSQFSNNDLDASERFSLGGTTGVRAYRPSEALADKGVVVQTELRYQIERITQRYDWLSSLETYLLLDGGSSELNSNGNNTSRDLTQQRTAWGLGFRIKGNDNFHIDLAAATRITDRESLVDQPDDDETNFWVQAIYWF